MEWGQDGLRTLVFGFRRVSEAEFQGWFTRFSAAMGNIAEVCLPLAHLLDRVLRAQASAAVVRMIPPPSPHPCLFSHHQKIKHDAHQYPNDIDDAMDSIECGLTLLVRGGEPHVLVVPVPCAQPALCSWQCTRVSACVCFGSHFLRGRLAVSHRGHRCGACEPQGATANEDALQEGVPDCVSTLGRCFCCRPCVLRGSGEGGRVCLRGTDESASFLRVGSACGCHCPSVCPTCLQPRLGSRRGCSLATSWKPLSTLPTPPKC